MAARAWHPQQRWCPRPHYTAYRVDLDPPTRLAEGKPSRKNRPLSVEGKEPRRRLCRCHHHYHHHHQRRVSSVSLVIGLPPLARYYRYRQRHRHCIPVASPPTTTAINRHLAERGYDGNFTDRGPRRCFHEREENARAKSDDTGTISFSGEWASVYRVW